MSDTQSNSIKLFFAVFIRFALVFIILGALFFSTSGTFSYINGWIYLGTIFFTLGTGFTILFIRDKSLLAKRINTSEKDPNQKVFILVSSILITILYTIPGLDFRFSWSRMPFGLVIVGELILLVGYSMNISVMLVNSYASRVVEIQKEQKVIDKGMYSVVRHPMYLSMVLVYLGTCLILGSYISFIPCVLLVISLGYRAVFEERTLKEGLAGYSEYMKKVKYRIIPLIW